MTFPYYHLLGACCFPHDCHCDRRCVLKFFFLEFRNFDADSAFPLHLYYHMLIQYLYCLYLYHATEDDRAIGFWIFACSIEEGFDWQMKELVKRGRPVKEWHTTSTTRRGRFRLVFFGRHINKRPF